LPIAPPLWSTQLPRKWIAILLTFLTFLVLIVAVPTLAQNAPAKSAATQGKRSTSTEVDYGAKDSPGVSSLATDVGSDTVNPIGQAWQAFEALLIVLGVLVGTAYLLKRTGLVKDGKFKGIPLDTKGWSAIFRSFAKPIASPAPIASEGRLQIVDTQVLPGANGASVHLISVADRTLLIGATGQNVSLIAEWDTEAVVSTGAEATKEEAKFDAYLDDQGIQLANSPEPDVVDNQISTATDRFKAVLERLRDEEPAGSATN
jgi:flagellar biogenesis protein FliO